MRQLSIGTAFNPEQTRVLTAIMADRRINTGPAQPLTIANGSVTIPVNFSFFTISATGGSTDLNTIAGALDGDLIYIRIASASNAVVFKNGAGNLLCSGAADITVSSVNSLVTAHYDGALAKWKCAAIVT